MGTFSIWHWLIVLFMCANLAMIIHIAISTRTQGWQKILWLAAALMAPVIPWLIWLIARPSAAEADISKRVREAQAKALEAEALAREAEARARISKISGEKLHNKSSL